MIGWYARRLASMEPREMLWRLGAGARVPIEWVRYRSNRSGAPDPVASAVPEPHPIFGGACGGEFDRFRIFDLEFPLGFEFDWGRDYRNDKQAGTGFARSIDIRDPRVTGDIKYIWEINRHQHLAALAYSDAGTENLPYIVRCLDRWLTENPYMCGVNWTSSLEAGLRMISWAQLYPRVAPVMSATPGLLQRWFDSIYLHLRHIHRNRSLYSSANNHLVGELAGLYVGSVCFPLWPECREWAAEARGALEDEILAQVSEDGVNREQAMSYHLFTLELFLMAFLVGRNAGQEFSREYQERLYNMMRYLDSVATPAGDLPWYGDSDDARGFLFSASDTALAVTTQLGAILFEDARLLRFSKGLTTASKALIPGVRELPRTAAENRRELFRDGGLAALESRDGRTKLVMDFAPLGYTSIAAHGHADALSIWLALDDKYFLVDSGTFAYHSHPQWRAYFRGTAAHNTARVDGHDQSVTGGRFLWTEKAKTRLIRFEETAERVTIVAEHDGYTRLADPVVHRRTVEFDRASGTVQLCDEFVCQGRHEIELFFHLEETADISEVTAGKACVQWQGHQVTFRSDDAAFAWEVVRGREEPILGWRSTRFNQKMPSPTLRISGAIEGTRSIRTTIEGR